MATGLPYMVVRTGDEVMWVEPHRRGYVLGKVTEVKYEEVRVLEFGLTISHEQTVSLLHLRVRKPVIRTGDVVAESTFTGRILPGAQQGVVRPARLRDGRGWFSVEWKRGYVSRHRAADLVRVPIPDQDQELWPLSAMMADRPSTIKGLHL